MKRACYYKELLGMWPSPFSEETLASATLNVLRILALWPYVCWRQPT